MNAALQVPSGVLISTSFSVTGRSAADAAPVAADARAAGDAGPQPPRPLVERLALGVIALVLAGLFGAMSVTAYIGGEVFLGTMAAIGALMTVWAAGSSLRRG
jgi:hypothetical protein